MDRNVQINHVTVNESILNDRNLSTISNCSFNFLTNLLKLCDVYHGRPKSSCRYCYHPQMHFFQLISVLQILSWIILAIITPRTTPQSLTIAVAVLICTSIIILKIFLAYEFIFVFGYDHQVPWKCPMTDLRKQTNHNVYHHNNNVKSSKLLQQRVNLLFYVILLQIIIMIVLYCWNVYDSFYNNKRFGYAVWVFVLGGTVIALIYLSMLTPMVIVGYICSILLKYIFQLKQFGDILSTLNDNDNYGLIIQSYIKLYNDWMFDWSISFKMDYSINYNKKRKMKSSKFQFIVAFISIIVMCIEWIIINNILSDITHPGQGKGLGSLKWIFFTLFLILPILSLITFGLYGSLMTAEYYHCLDIVRDELNKLLCNLDDNNDNINQTRLKIGHLTQIITIMKTYPIKVTLFGYLISFKQTTKFVIYFLLARFVTFMLHILNLCLGSMAAYCILWLF